MIFVVGNSRSGTTMLGRILGKNSLVHTFGELHFFEEMVDSAQFRDARELDFAERNQLLARLLTASRRGYFAALNQNAYEGDIQKIIASAERCDAASLYAAFLQFEARRSGRTVPCEQTPRYLFYALDILERFPEARIVNMVRDPRAILYSQKYKWKRRFLGGSTIPAWEALRSWLNYHPLLISKLWSSCIRYGAELENYSRFKTIKFEELIDDPYGQVEDLCGFLGLEFEREMLDIPRVGSSHSLDEKTSLGIDAGRISGWRTKGLKSTEIDACEWVSSVEMQQLGYELVSKGKFGLQMVPALGLWCLKFLLALPFNLVRMRNPIEAIKRRYFARAR